MELKWKREKFNDGRIDYNLMDGGALVGYFRDYREGHHEWVNIRSSWDGELIDQPTLKKAKAVAMALVLLEG